MKKLSLKGKFSFCMFVVMAIFFATEVILLGMQYYTKDRLGDLIDKSNRVYELKTTFSEVLSAYKYYSVSQKEDDREAAKEALERLRSDSASLRHVIFEDSYIREIDGVSLYHSRLRKFLTPYFVILPLLVKGHSYSTHEPGNMQNKMDNYLEKHLSFQRKN